MVLCGSFASKCKAKKMVKKRKGVMGYGYGNGSCYPTRYGNNCLWLLFFSSMLCSYMVSGEEDLCSAFSARDADDFW